ncbi:hypothetical protein ABNB59_17095 [Paenibacillus larvae]|uniref:Uncharacterized protein n=1 Tax=Paenibacillus larvae TaxID=1464 RepID=A0AAP5JWD0_9BACL|nr:hypothetical protein [Paenibacillus larvae]MDR5604686.1 hypothetical protein [Paenibacillus larvae]MDT2233593.1 hypothetical protein [Paenibacillus larvae]MDT2253203.1 hypothetical protein [Paenibacillus larvae]MDT2269963.1 hypothetical protein [Paenibacillus larvae]MDT2306155.1 hypothetical protein [Paenibacillus larvae]
MATKKGLVNFTKLYCQWMKSESLIADVTVRKKYQKARPNASASKAGLHGCLTYIV